MFVCNANLPLNCFSPFFIPVKCDSSEHNFTLLLSQFEQFKM